MGNSPISIGWAASPDVPVFDYDPEKAKSLLEEAGWTGDGIRQKDGQPLSFTLTLYPDYAAPVAGAVLSGKAERGILVCSTGVGMSIAANKFPGIRAALGVNAEEVRLTRAHNDANILTLGAQFTDEAAAEALADVFLRTEFDGGRHRRRLAKIAALERNGLQREESKGG